MRESSSTPLTDAHSSTARRASPLDLNASMNDARFRNRRLVAIKSGESRATFDRSGIHSRGVLMALDHSWDRDAVIAIVNALKHEPGALMPILRRIQDDLGW